MANFLESLGLPSPGSLLDAFSGRTGAEVSLAGARSQTELGREALAQQQEALQRLIGTLAPFTDISGQLPTGAFDPEAAAGLEQDPAFTAAADRLQNQILAQQAARGRVGAGETPLALQSGLTRLGGDFLSRQRGDLLSALQLAQSSAAQQAFGTQSTGARAGDLLTQIGAAQAAGGLGAAQALGQGSSNILGAAAGIASFFSDRSLKENIRPHGEYKGHNTYRYNYKGDNQEYIGVMADEVKETAPHAVTNVNGYDVVDYGEL